MIHSHLQRRGLVVRWVLAALVLVGLLGPISHSSAHPVSAAPKILRVAFNGFENNITPFTLTFGSRPNHHDLLMLVYDSLFWPQASLHPEPWLAEKATPSLDRKAWTVTLRRGLVWHDGVPLTADDVRFTFEYFLKQGRETPRYAHHVYDTPAFVGADVTDTRTVVLRFDAPAPTFKILPGADLPIVPKHIWQDVVDPAKEKLGLPIGSGPFKVAQIVPGERYRLVANRSYFKGPPSIDEIDMPIMSNPDAATAALRAGDVDMVAATLTPQAIESVEHTPGVRLKAGRRLSSTALYFNARRPPFDDPRVRKAVSLAIDPREMVDVVLSGHGRPGVDSFIHPDSPWALPGAGHEHDPTRAGDLLDEAGYRMNADAGVRMGPTGVRLELSVLVSEPDPRELAAAELLVHQLQAIGVKLSVTRVDEVAFSKTIQVPYGRPGEFDLYISSEESHIHVDPDALFFLFHSVGRAGFGFRITGYGNPVFDKLAEEARTSEIPRRQVLFYEMERIVERDAPLVALWYADDVSAYRPSAYDGWASEAGHGIFTKRSFLPGGAPTTGRGPSIVPTGSGLVIVGVGTALVVACLFRRRRLRHRTSLP